MLRHVLLVTGDSLTLDLRVALSPTAGCEIARPRYTEPGVAGSAYRVEVRVPIVSDPGGGIRSRGGGQPEGAADDDRETNPMARYLISVLDERTNSATEDEMAAIGAFNAQLRADGHWVFAGGLAAPDTATVIDARGEETIFTDGPYLESKEYVGGFWIIEAPHFDVALRLAAQGSKSCNRRVELRPFLG
jgi:hypothetical protein